MWRPPFTILRKVFYPATLDHAVPKIFYSTRSRLPRSTTKITLISASVGVLVGAGYGGYTHYFINSKKQVKPIENEEYVFLKNPPEYTAHYKIVNDTDSSNLELILFQYRTCPFCCKVRAYLDLRGINYEIVEVDAVLRQDIKWSRYKKVPIVLAKVDGGYQQLQDSTAIVSIVETYLKDKSTELQNIVRYYPVTKYVNDEGKTARDITNKYFVMHNDNIKAIDKDIEAEERMWRQWADTVLVHTLSPNVYRTPSEALETFKWFEEAGSWRTIFPGWECNLMVYVGATAMYFIAKILKKRHNIEDARQSLYNASNKWMSAIRKKGTRFLGGDTPNLADISVYGVLSSIEGCQAFLDLRQNSEVGKWFDDVKNMIERRKGKIVYNAIEN